MNEEEKKEEIQEEEEPKFPYPYPTMRCICSIFLVYFITLMIPMRGNGTVPDGLLVLGIGICGVLALYLFITGYKGQLVRREYAYKMDAIRRKELKEQQKAEEEKKKAEKKKD